MMNLFDYIDTNSSELPDSFGILKTLYASVIAPALTPKYSINNYLKGNSPSISWANPVNRIALFPLLHHLLPTAHLHINNMREKLTTAGIESLEAAPNPSGYFNPLIFSQPNQQDYRLDLLQTLTFYPRTLALALKVGYQPDEKATKILQLMNPDIVSDELHVLIKDKIVLILTRTTLSPKSVRGIVPLLPLWFKDAFTPLTDQTKTILKALAQPTAEPWFATYQAFLNRPEFMENVIRSKITEFTKNYAAQRRSMITQQLDQLERCKIDYLQKYTQTLIQISDIGCQLLGLTSADDMNATALIDLLIKQTSMIPIFDTSQTGLIKLVVVAPLVLYDPECLKPVLKNTEVDHLRDQRSFITTILDLIFIQEKYDLYTVSHMKIDIRNCSVGRTDPIPYVLSTGCQPIKQPHIGGHNCFGTNATHIKNALVRTDLFGAIQQILSATQNMNFSDATVFRTLSDSLRSYSTTKCLFDKAAGIFISPKEVYEKEKK